MSDPPAARDDHFPARKSLRTKAFVVTLAMLAYLFGAVMYVSAGRAKIYDSVQALEQIARHERALAMIDAALSGAMVDVREASSAESARGALPSELLLYMENCGRLFAALEEFDPAYALLQRAVERSYVELQRQPMRANWIDLRETLTRVHQDLEIRRGALTERRDLVNQSYHRQYDAVTVESLLLTMLGVAVFGTLAAWFFASLTADIRRLEQHARQVVRGTRGIALTVRRDDELGHLMHAVNRMAVDLDEREKQVEVEVQRRSHQDKMLAVGALAAGVAHEVNNPLAVISGIAQEWRTSDQPPTAEEIADGTTAIIAQVQRAAQATRHLAEAAAPEIAELDWVDLNALVRRVVQLMGYDRRYRRFAFDPALDPALPAVLTSGNSVQQVLMQMLTLACDAVAADPGAPAKVAIQTRADPEAVEVWLQFAPVLDFTRREVQRTLLLSRAIIEPLRGRLAFGQAEGPLLRIKLALPAAGGGDEG